MNQSIASASALASAPPCSPLTYRSLHKVQQGLLHGAGQQLRLEIALVQECADGFLDEGEEDQGDYE